MNTLACAACETAHEAGPCSWCGVVWCGPCYELHEPGCIDDHDLAPPTP
jgi:hypothetical protein